MYLSENSISSAIRILSRRADSIKSCHCFCLFVLLSTFVSTSICQETPSGAITTETVVKVAVRAHSGVEAAITQWSATTEYLSHSFQDEGRISLPTFIKYHWDWCLYALIIVVGLTLLLLYIAKLNKTLKNLSNTLEQEVEERTCQLRQSNQQLIQENTERKRAEITLQESEHRYHRLFEDSPISYISCF